MDYLITGRWVWSITAKTYRYRLPPELPNLLPPSNPSLPNHASKLTQACPHDVPGELTQTQAWQVHYQFQTQAALSCIYTYTHTYIHTYNVHRYIYTSIHIYTYTHKYIHTYILELGGISIFRIILVNIGIPLSISRRFFIPKYRKTVRLCKMRAFARQLMTQI